MSAMAVVVVARCLVARSMMPVAESARLTVVAAAASLRDAPSLQPAQATSSFASSTVVAVAARFSTARLRLATVPPTAAFTRISLEEAPIPLPLPRSASRAQPPSQAQQFLVPPRRPVNLLQMAQLLLSSVTTLDTITIALHLPLRFSILLLQAEWWSRLL